MMATRSLASLFLLLACAAGAGCGSNESGAAATGGGGRKLHLLTWSDYFADDTIAGFEKKHGCKVVLDYMESSETLRTRLASPPSGFDVVFPSDEVVAGLIAKGVFEKLDHAKVPNLKNLAPRFRGLVYDPRNEYSVAYMWGTTGIAYDKEKVVPAPDSWKALFDEKHSSKTTLLDDAREVFTAAIRAEGGEAMTPEAIDRAKELLKKRKPLAYDSAAKRLLIVGDAWISQIFSGDALQAVEETKGRVVYVIPKEGGTLWIDNMCIARGAPEPDLAHAFIDYMLEPEVSAAITNQRRFPNPNQAAEKLVKKEVRENPLVYPPEDVLARGHVLGEIPPETKKKLDAAWAEVRAD